jgi:hypothetical protein
MTPVCCRLLLLLPLLQTVPAGDPDAFTGKVFVFSGVLPYATVCM